MKKLLSSFLALIMLISVVQVCGMAYAQTVIPKPTNVKMTYDEEDMCAIFTFDTQKGTYCQIHWSIIGEDGCCIINNEIDNEKTLTIDTLFAGYDYIFKVYAYKTINGEECLSEPVVLKYSTKNDKIKLSYESTKNGFKMHIAAKYRSNYDWNYMLYKYNNQTGKYEFKRNVVDGTVINGNIDGKYVVRSKCDYYGSVVYSDFSNAIIPHKSYNDKVKLVSAKSKKPAKARITWTKANAKRFTGYQLQYSDGADGFSVYVNDVNRTYKNLTLPEGVEFRFRVRPIAKKNGGYIYGKWSGEKRAMVVSALGTKVNAKKIINKQKLRPYKAHNKRLDKILNIIIKKYTNKNMSTYDKVYACYKYVSNKRFSNYGIKGKNEYTGGNAAEYFALELLDAREGVCDNYNSLFALLLKKIGIKDVRMSHGYTQKANGSWTGHSWVTVKMGKHFYIFDPRLQSYRSNKNGFDYFCVPMTHKDNISHHFIYSGIMYYLGNDYSWEVMY